VTVRIAIHFANGSLEEEIAGMLSDMPDLEVFDMASELQFGAADVLLTDEPGLATLVDSGDADVIPIVALAAGGDAAIGRALRKGARAAIPDHAGAAMVAAACRAAAAGLVARPARSAAATRTRRSTRIAPELVDPLPDAAPLTPRERDVLRLLAGGLGNKAIARRLGISAETVKAHVSAILAKLHATTRTEAVAVGARRGLIVL
jgi:DNA-binding NarL/FixJ family response regulator